MADVNALLDTIEIRLRETLQVFSANQTINRMARENEKLFTMVNSNFTFWHACAIAFGPHVIQGITALTLAQCAGDGGLFDCQMMRFIRCRPNRALNARVTSSMYVDFAGE